MLDEIQLFYNLKETLNVEPQDDYNFIECGGASLKAVLFVEKLGNLAILFIDLNFISSL